MSKQTQANKILQVGGGILFLMICGFIFYTDWLMIRPHLTPFLFASGSAIVLRPVCMTVENIIKICEQTHPTKVARLLAIVCLLAIVAFLLVAEWYISSIVSLILGMYVILVVPSKVQRSTKAIFIVLLLLFFAAFTCLAWFFKSCLDETQIATELVMDVLAKNQEMISSLSNTSALKEMSNQAVEWCEYSVMYLPESLGGVVDPVTECTKQINGFATNAQSYLDTGLEFAADNVGLFTIYLKQFFFSSTTFLSQVPLSAFVFFSLLLFFLSHYEEISNQMFVLCPLSYKQTTLLADVVSFFHSFCFSSCTLSFLSFSLHMDGNYIYIYIYILYFHHLYISCVFNNI